MAENEETVYSRTFQVDAYETDASSRATPETLCNYMQEIAGQHAQQMGVDIKALNQNNQTWVLYRMHVKFHELPYWQTPVHIETWPSDADTMRAYRSFEAKNADSDTPIAGALSYWMILDMETRRPVQMPEELQNRHFANRTWPVAPQYDRLKFMLSEESAYKAVFRVRRSDIDMNRHVNNVAYINWALEAMPREYHHQHSWKPVELDIQYHAETFQDEAVVSKAAPLTNAEDEIEWGHEIRKQDSGKVLSMAKSRWVKV